MSECELCGEARTQFYFEGPDYPDWEDDHYTDRRAVGVFFCSVKHMVLWLLDKGFNVRPIRDEDGDSGE